jgi:hypothetical protein
MEMLLELSNIIEKNPKLFEVRFSLSGKANWVMTYDECHRIYGYLKASMRRDTYESDLNIIILGFKSSKFVGKFKTFVDKMGKFRQLASDIQLGQSPAFKPIIPKNKNFHTKGFLLTTIIDWYISYLNWEKKIKLPPKLKNIICVCDSSDNEIDVEEAERDASGIPDSDASGIQDSDASGIPDSDASGIQDSWEEIPNNWEEL